MKKEKKKRTRCRKTGWYSPKQDTFVCTVTLRSLRRIPVYQRTIQIPWNSRPSRFHGQKQRPPFKSRRETPGRTMKFVCSQCTMAPVKNYARPIRSEFSRKPVTPAEERNRGITWPRCFAGRENEKEGKLSARFRKPGRVESNRNSRD